MVGTEKLKKSKEVKIALLLGLLGPDGEDVYATFDWEEGEVQDLETVLSKFDRYCEPRLNISMARFKFFSLVQANKKFDDFVVQLKSLAGRCKFGELSDSLIRDMIIYHCSSDRLRRKLLAENDPDLQRVKEIARAEEESVRHAEVISAARDTSTVDETALAVSGPGQARPKAEVCMSCGLHHGVDRTCPAVGQECHKCHSTNHFARMCQSSTTSANGSAGVAVILEQRGERYKNEMQEQLLRVAETGTKRRGWYQYVEFGGKKVEFLVDTAADASVVSERTALTITKDIWKTKRVFRSYGGFRVPIVGEFEAEIKYKAKQFLGNFVVAGGDCENILGLPDLKRFGIMGRGNHPM
jgi:hypothetical protein